MNESTREALREWVWAQPSIAVAANDHPDQPGASAGSE